MPHEDPPTTSTDPDYECLDCGTTVETETNDVCPDCGGTLRNRSVPME